MGGVAGIRLHFLLRRKQLLPTVFELMAAAPHWGVAILFSNPAA